MLEEAAWELVRAIAVVYPKLGASSVPLVITGGAILHGRCFAKAFKQACEAQKLVFTAVHSGAEPAEDALKFAWKLSWG